MSRGTEVAIAVASTLGSADSRARSDAAKARERDASGLPAVKSYAASSTPSRRNPGSVSRVSRKLRRNNPAALKTINARATCVPMSPGIARRIAAMSSLAAMKRPAPARHIM